MFDGNRMFNRDSTINRDFLEKMKNRTLNRDRTLNSFGHKIYDRTVRLIETFTKNKKQDV